MARRASPGACSPRPRRTTIWSMRSLIERRLRRELLGDPHFKKLSARRREHQHVMVDYLDSGACSNDLMTIDAKFRVKYQRRFGSAGTSNFGDKPARLVVVVLRQQRALRREYIRPAKAGDPPTAEIEIICVIALVA